MNAMRDTLESSPVTALGHTVDADEKSDKRMAEALAVWDSLGQASIDWTMADNSVVPLTKADLQDLYDEMRRVRALRGLQLHARARQLKAQLPDLTLRDIQPDNW